MKSTPRSILRIETVTFLPEEYDRQNDSDVLPEGATLLNGQYVIERYLSSGGFGITYFARDSLDRRVVIKECFPEAYCSRKNRTVLARSQAHQGEFKSIVDMFMREAHSIAKLNHPNIVGVHQVFQDNETAYMALDLIDGKDLLDIIEASSEIPRYKDVKEILLKVLDAIETVHGQDMLHRDISPDNILIDTMDNPILIDFGAAREEASKKSRALSAVLVVKDGYSPQEFYIAGSRQTPCSDLYALGATFFHLITGDAPPNSQSRMASLASDRPDPYQPLVGRVPGYSRDFLEAIDIAMNVFPQDRIQSATDWIMRIDDEKRAAAALAHAQTDQEIEKTVTRLIQHAQVEADADPRSETKNAVEEHARHNRAEQKTEEKHALGASPEDYEETAKPDVKWIIKAMDLPYGSEPPAPSQRAEKVSDWIAKCREKLAPPEEDEVFPEIDFPSEKRPAQMLDRPGFWLVLGVALGIIIFGGIAVGQAAVIGP